MSPVNVLALVLCYKNISFSGSGSRLATAMSRCLLVSANQKWLGGKTEGEIGREEKQIRCLQKAHEVCQQKGKHLWWCVGWFVALYWNRVHATKNFVDELSIRKRNGRRKWPSWRINWKRLRRLPIRMHAWNGTPKSWLNYSPSTSEYSKKVRLVSLIEISTMIWVSNGRCWIFKGPSKVFLSKAMI